MTNINKSKSVKDFKRILLILDDVCSDSNLSQSKALKKLCTRGRHLGITVFISLQFVNQIYPFCRNNADKIFVGQLNSSDFDNLCTNFMAGNISKKEFKNIYNNSVLNYNFLIINNNTVNDCNDLNLIYSCIITPNDFIDK